MKPLNNSIIVLNSLPNFSGISLNKSKNFLIYSHFRSESILILLLTFVKLLKIVRYYSTDS